MVLDEFAGCAANWSRSLWKCKKGQHLHEGRYPRMVVLMQSSSNVNQVYTESVFQAPNKYISFKFLYYNLVLLPLYRKVCKHVFLVRNIHVTSDTHVIGVVQMLQPL